MSRLAAFSRTDAESLADAIDNSKTFRELWSAVASAMLVAVWSRLFGWKDEK